MGGGEGLADVIKLKVSRWRNDPGLSGWTLNAITSILTSGGKGRFHTQRREVNVS